MGFHICQKEIGFLIFVSLTYEYSTFYIFCYMQMVLENRHFRSHWFSFYFKTSKFFSTILLYCWALYIYTREWMKHFTPLESEILTAVDPPFQIFLYQTKIFMKLSTSFSIIFLWHFFRNIRSIRTIRIRKECFCLERHREICGSSMDLENS